MMPRLSERQTGLVALALLLMAAFELWTTASLRAQRPWLAAMAAAFPCIVIAGVILVWRDGAADAFCAPGRHFPSLSNFSAAEFMQ